MLRALDSMERRVWLQRNASDIRIQLPKPPCRANKRSSGSHDRDQVCDASRSLLPDFVRCRRVVRAPVRIIGILVGVKILLGIFLREFMGDTSGAVRSLSRIGKDDICAVRL